MAGSRAWPGTLREIGRRPRSSRLCAASSCAFVPFLACCMQNGNGAHPITSVLMKTMIDFDTARTFAIPMTTRFRGIDVREGMLIEGPAGWGEFSAFAEYGDAESASWLTAALEACTVGWPDPVRGRIPVNATVPAVGPQDAHRIAAASGCRTVKVKVADSPSSLPADLERLAAVRDALGPSGLVRCDANGAWDVDAAVSAIAALDRAAGGLEYVEQPCATIEELAAVRRRVSV